MSIIFLYYYIINKKQLKIEIKHPFYVISLSTIDLFMIFFFFTKKKKKEANKEYFFYFPLLGHTQ